VRPILLILLLASFVAGQDEPWRTEPLDPDALAERRKEIEKGLQPPAADASEEEKAWHAARSRRVALLGDLERAARTYGALPAVPESVARQESRASELAELREKPEEPLPPVSGNGGLAPLEEAARAAAKEDEAAQARLEGLRKAGREFEKYLQAAAARQSELRARIDKAGDAPSGSVQAYRRANAQLELRYWEVFTKSSAEVRHRIDAAIAAEQVARDLTKLRAERTARRLAAGRERMQRRAAEEAKEKEAEAKRLAEQAARENDPLYRFVAEIRVRAAQHLTRSKKDEQVNAGLERERDLKKRALERTEGQDSLIQSRIETRRAIAPSTAAMLRTTLGNTKSSRREAEEYERRKIDRRVNDVLQELGPLQDLAWSLEVPTAETPHWEELAAGLPGERRDEALRELEEALRGPDGLVAAVRARRQSLERRHELLNEIDSLNDAYAAALARLEALITSHIVWVRTEEPIGFHLLAGTLKDAGRVRDFYAEPEFVSEFRAALDRNPGMFSAAGLFLVVLLVGATLAARSIRARPMHRPRAGEHLRSGLADAARALAHAAAPSLVLLLAAALVRRVELPPRIILPALAALRGVAFFLFVQRLTWGLLSKRGYLVAHFGVSREVGNQIIRSVRLYTFAGMLLWIPFRFLSEADFDTGSLQRIFGTGFRFCELLAVALLLPRRQPVARAFVSGNETALRFLGILNPFLFLAFLVIVVMDVRGYVDGARYFTERVMESTVAVVILRALYAGLNQISGRVTERVRERAFREQGGTAAWEDSNLVTRQLTRLITTGVIVAAVVILVRAWGVGATSILAETRLAELSDGVVLTAADVFTAILFILAAHFISANIAGLFELLVFPIFGRVHRGTRFVVLALSRYLILLVGYSGALLAVHFSVSNLGWLLAAASVGLGFGLQEIVANFVSGLILLVEQPVRVGDIITVGETGGTVEKITIRSTVVTNWDQQQIIIPNKALITQNLTNWTRNNNFTRRQVPVTVAYGTDVEKVLGLLDEAVKSVEHVRTYPPARIWFDGFGDSGLQFAIWYYIDIEFGFSSMTDVRRAVYGRLQDAGIEIPFPQRDVHVRRDPFEEQQGAAGTLE